MYEGPDHGDDPDTEGFPPEVAGLVRDAWARLEASADWVIWGSGMSEPQIATGFTSGTPFVFDDKRILAVRRVLGTPEGSPTNEEVCKRIVECVNGFEGVGAPVEFMAEVRALLLDCVNGDFTDAGYAVRFTSLLARCIPLNEIKNYEAEAAY